MKRSFLATASLALACAFAACCQPIAQAAQAVYSVYRRVKDWAVDFTLGALKLAGGEDEGEAKPAVMLTQAKAFVLRLAKRQRPELSAGWRMCPST